MNDMTQNYLVAGPQRDAIAILHGVFSDISNGVP